MCGRFTLTMPSYAELTAALGVAASPEQAALYRPRYNVAPSDAGWVLRMTAGVRELVQADWGLVPRWSKTLEQVGRPINARAETLEQKPSFRESFARRRCVVVGDGFFEWDKSGGQRQPIWFRPRDGGLLLMAGVFDEWFDVERARRVRTFAIVTTDAGADVADVHDRMPVVLATGTDVGTWLTVPALDQPAEVTDDVRALLRPLPEGSLVRKLVSKRVGSPRNDDASILEPDPPGDGAPGEATSSQGAGRRGGREERAATGATLSLFGDDVVATPRRRAR